MKTKIITIALTGIVLVGVNNGCKKQEAAAPASETFQNQSDSAGKEAQKTVVTAQAQTEVVKAKSADVAVTAQAQLDAAAAQARANSGSAKAETAEQTSKAQSLIDQAKKLLSENKWSEAQALLSQLSGQSLTPEQQSMVQSLTGQAQKAGEAVGKVKAADNATKALGGLLPNN